MPKSTVTRGAGLHWDAAARDYALYRPTYPAGFFHLLQHLGIGVPAQRILDLGAGTGALSVPFAEQGAQVRRLLAPGGLVLISSLIWSADDPVSRETNALLSRWNPAYDRAERRRVQNPNPIWCEPPFQLRTFHAYREALTFSRESWRGRIRAAKWIGAALPPEKVEAFDREHAEILERRFPERFPVLHDITLHVLQAQG